MLPIKIMIFASIFAAMLSSISGTATTFLSGGCSHTLVNGSTGYMTFNLANNVSSTATNLTITSELNGASAYNPIEEISSIDHGKNAAINFNLYNFSLPGSYAEGFIVQYTQAGVNRLAVFPCLLNISQQALSDVSFTETKFLNGSLTATMLNQGEVPLYVNVSLIAPAGFMIIPKTSSVNIQSDSFAGVNFNIFFPQNALFVNASYLITVVLSYTKSNIHYASYSTILVSHHISINEVTNPTTVPANQISGPVLTSTCVIYLTLLSMVFIIGLFLMLLGALMYAVSHVGNETIRGRLQNYGINMIVGGIALVVLAELVPYLLTLIADGIFLACS